MKLGKRHCSAALRIRAATLGLLFVLVTSLTTSVQAQRGEDRSRAVLLEALRRNAPLGIAPNRAPDARLPSQAPAPEMFKASDFDALLAPKSTNPAVVWMPDQSTLNALNDQFWGFAARTECPQPQWTPNYTSLSSYQNSAAALRQQLLAWVGQIPATPQGSLLSSTPVFSNARYTIDWVRLSSRLPGISVFGYLARPIGVASPGPAVILLHGPQTPPHTAFGWRLTGDGGYVAYGDQPLVLAAVGVDLVESGYTVFVPWLDDSEPTWPYFHWYEVDRWSALRAVKTGTNTGGHGLLVPQVMAGVDFLTSDPQVKPNQIALMGWSLGAQVAGVTAALDNRVGALILLAPPVDSRALRSDPFEIRDDSVFAMLDCAFRQVEIAAMVAPRPLLFSYSESDPRFPLYENYVSEAIFMQAADIYNRLGYASAIELVSSATQHAAVAEQPLAWLNQTFTYTPRPLPPGDYLPPAPSNWPFTLAFQNQERSEMANYLVSLGSCPPVSVTPDFSSTEAYANSLVPFRANLLTDLAGGTLPPEQTTAILERRTVTDNSDYLLEWVRFRSRVSNVEMAGYLSTPHKFSGRRPAVLSLDNDVSVGLLFGLETETAPYLHAYGDRLARLGYVVFAPYLPGYLIDGVGGIIRAKSNNTRNIWNFVLPFYMSGTDFLLAQSNVDPSRISAYGLSFSGVAALYITALDSRLAALVFSNYAADMYAFALQPVSYEWPIWQTLVCSPMNPTQKWLVAPRRFIWESGVNGAGFDDIPALINQIEQVYESLGVGWRFRLYQHIGGHETFGGADQYYVPPEGFVIFYPPPQISAVKPPYSFPGQVVSVQGSGFLPSAVVQIGGSQATTTWAQDTNLFAQVPSVLGGEYDVTVINPDGYMGTQSGGLFVLGRQSIYLPEVSR